MLAALLPAEIFGVLLVIFALDLRRLMLRALVESYQLFVPGEALPFGDFAEMIARVMSKTFLLAFQLATPFIAAATIFYLGVGLLARLMPQVHDFFVAMPLQITLGLIMMSLALPFVMRLKGRLPARRLHCSEGHWRSCGADGGDG